MMPQYLQTFDNRLNTILHYTDRFWKHISKLFDQVMTRNRYSPLNLDKKKTKLYRQPQVYRICTIFMCIFIVIIFPMLSLFEFSTISTYPEVLETYDVHKSIFISKNDSLILNIYNHSIHHIYIDIGCFNGETIEHFIHFTPNSILYDIITFEPDPINYRLCKQKLSHIKYRNYNIIIIPKVVWIHDGEVAYEIDRGQRSGIYQDRTKSAHNVVKLDGIDFSSWLSNLTTSNNTKIRIKISMPGAETRLLRKMVVDDTLSLADRWDVEWSQRANPRTYPQRIYLQSMLDSVGYSCAGFTRLQDVRRVFKMNQTYASVKKYNDLVPLPDSDTYSHYIQRPVVTDPPRTRKPRVK